jgi:hypothetical protein
MRRTVTAASSSTSNIFFRVSERAYPKGAFPAKNSPLAARAAVDCFIFSDNSLLYIS